MASKHQAHWLSCIFLKDDETFFSSFPFSRLLLKRSREKKRANVTRKKDPDIVVNVHKNSIKYFPFFWDILHFHSNGFIMLKLFEPNSRYIRSLGLRSDVWTWYKKPSYRNSFRITYLKYVLNYTINFTKPNSTLRLLQNLY